MALISFTPLQDGVTGVNAAATNTPLSTIYNDYNGNITDANVSASAAIAFSKVSGGTSAALVAWTSWTPSWTNLTIGNATQVCAYIQIGKMVHFRINVTLGSTSSVGTSVQLSLPVTAKSSAYNLASQIIGPANFLDNPATVDNIGGIRIDSTTLAQIISFNAAGTTTKQAAITPTSPFTWGTGYLISAVGTYEAA